MNQFKRKISAFFFAIRPYENLQHFLFTVAGFIYATYKLAFFEISLKSFIGSITVLSFLSQVLSYNNYATFELDLVDESKKFQNKFEGINKTFLLKISIFFFVLTILSSLFINIISTLYFILLMFGWILYTHPKLMMKRNIIFPFILDILTMPYLTIFGSYVSGYFGFDLLIFSIFFGLIEIAGHLNHYNLDYEVDKKTKIFTIAHSVGRKNLFLLTVFFFGISSFYFLIISIFKIIPLYTGFSYIPGFIFQLIFTFKILKKNMDYNFPLKFRTFYRILFFLESLFVVLTLLLL